MAEDKTATPETETETENETTEPEPVYVVNGQEIRQLATKEEAVNFTVEAAIKLGTIMPGAEDKIREIFEQMYDESAVNMRVIQVTHPTTDIMPQPCEIAAFILREHLKRVTETPPVDPSLPSFMDMLALAMASYD
ncbi:hypothetical protein FWF48_02190 [Candidatus Saccharibacteria bacterium]|nr:hypothetical protein [Candidatus Saccharibacteria bacterium]